MTRPDIITLVLLFFHIASGRIYVTDDAIITKVDDRTLRARSSSIDINGPQSVKVEDRSCVTFDRSPGRCLPVRECYPYTRAHQDLGNLEAWVIGTRGTCNYVDPDGKQVYGVCCQTPVLRDNRTLKWEVFDESLDVKGNFSDASSRIVGGANSISGEYPFMAGIMKDGKVYCGGSLLDEVHVLTAAHCISGLSSQGVAQLTIILGTVNLRDPDKVTRRVYSVTRHKSFDGSKLYNDIALITLDNPVKFTSTVSPVCLYDDQGVNHDGREAIAIGWGNIRDGGPRAETLQKVSLTIKNQAECQKNFGAKAPGGIVDHMICAAAPGRDSCAGDSGGPLMMYRGNRQCQVGIVSWGIGCATDTYGVYTRLSAFQVWINRNRIRY